MIEAPPAYRYAYHVALDGNGINGLEGMAGVCIFLFDPDSHAYAYKVKYFDGAAAGHAVSINPSGKVGFLGNAAQHLIFYDAATAEEIDRISTLRFEPPDTSLQGSTHVVWLDDTRFVTAIGKHFYRFDLNDLGRPERLMPHRVMLPHAMKLSPSRRYLCYGSMDNPRFGRRGEARHVGIWDLAADTISIVDLPATCWHVAAHRCEDLFYAVSFRVAPQDRTDYHDWGMAFLKEYLFELDPQSAGVRRHWAAGRETPAHINSDITMSDSEIIFCNGASQTIVAVDLQGMRKFRIIDERPDFATALEHPRQAVHQVYDSLARGNFFGNSQHFLGALRISRFTLMDSVYGCQLSNDQSLLFTANRGLNHITIYDYPSAAIRLRVKLPDLQKFMPDIGPLADPRLGFHHSTLIG